MTARALPRRHPSAAVPRPALSVWLLLALLLVSLAWAPRAAAQEGAGELLGILKARASAAASAASAAAAAEAASAPPPANPKLVQQAARATQKDDERILAEITARLARNPAFGKVVPAVQAGVARLTGSVTDNDSRQLATKVVSAIGGVVAVENELVLAADFRARLRETWELAKDRGIRLVTAIPLLLLAVLVVLLFNLLGRWLAAHLHWVRMESRNPFLGTLLRRSVRSACVLIGILIALDLLEATALVTALLGSAGVVGIVLGFAFRDMAENYLSGILLSLRQPFDPRDHVRIDSHEGRVVSLSTRNTVLMTLDGNELRLPNATVFKAVILNFTHNPRRRFSFSLVVGSGEDLQAAQDLGVATLAAMTGVLADPGPSASVDQIVDAAATLSYFAWVNQTETDFSKARSEAIRLVRNALQQGGICPPGPVQRIQLTRSEPPSDPWPGTDDRPVRPVDPRAVARDQADVSPSDELDEQLDAELARKASTDMLRAPGSKKD